MHALVDAALRCPTMKSFAPIMLDNLMAELKTRDVTSSQITAMREETAMIAREMRLAPVELWRRLGVEGMLSWIRWTQRASSIGV